jgi:hypothetical protein
MMGLMLLACPHRIEEHHLKPKGCLPPIGCFSMWLQQKCVVTHMGVNSQLGTPHVAENRLQCMSLHTPNGPKRPACLELFMAWTFRSCSA